MRRHADRAGGFQDAVGDIREYSRCGQAQRRDEQALRGFFLGCRIAVGGDGAENDNYKICHAVCTQRNTEEGAVLRSEYFVAIDSVGKVATGFTTGFDAAIYQKSVERNRKAYRAEIHVRPGKTRVLGTGKGRSTQGFASARG